MCAAKTEREETNEEIKKLDSTPPEIHCTVVCGFTCSASMSCCIFIGKSTLV